MKTTYDLRVTTYHTGPDGVLRAPVVLDYFQESAQRQLEDLGIGLDYTGKNHWAWILVKYEIEFYRYPKAEEEVTVETEAVGFRGFEAYRRFALKRGDETLVEGKSVWVLADTETGKLVRVKNIEEITKSLGETGQVYKVGRMKKLTEAKLSKEYDVRYEDIDINRHVNNVRYLVWAIEALPPEVVKAYEIKRVSIVYKEQSFYGERVEVFTEETEDGYRIDIMRDGTLLTQIKITLKKREKDIEF